MEQTFYPSRVRVLAHRYLMPGAIWMIAFGMSVLNAFLRERPLPDFDWLTFLIVWAVAIVFDILLNRVWAEGLAIRITSTAISGPIGVGRAEPIQLDEIDYNKTLHRRRFGKTLLANKIFSVRGDRLDIYDSLFEPEDVAEIQQLLFEGEREQRKGLE